MRLFTTSILLMLSFISNATTVRLETNFGNIDIEMKEDEAPLTVANFLNYVNDGDYDNSIIHRTVVNFVVQGGEFYSNGNQIVEIPADSSVMNEFNLSNIRGTVAMAKLTDQPNSATNNFFFNIADNSANLDNQNGGFTVFGEVVAGMDVVDLIASIQTLSGFPLIGYIASVGVQLNDYVYINRAYVLPDTFQITEGISGAWVTPGINGQGLYMEVLPAVNVIVLAWFTFDSTSPDPAVPSNIGDAGNRWLTASGTYQDNAFSGAIFKTSGGLFDSLISVNNTEIGTLTIDFENCSNASMSYILNDADEFNTIALQRVSGINVDFCEALANDAAPGIAAQ